MNEPLAPGALPAAAAGAPASGAGVAVPAAPPATHVPPAAERVPAVHPVAQAMAASANDVPALAPPPAVPEPAPRSRVAFTGAGSEYFRIWVVNLLLSLVSLGIYSAWAKVRKTRYFYQNTRLDGHAFDYHGAPLAILRGRVVAVVLLLAYTWSFDISRTAGLITIGVLCFAGPWLFMKAQQFRFRNSSWRGLRFGFDADLKSSYRTLLPLIVLWFSGTILSALVVPAPVLAVAGGTTGLLVPLMHHTLKRYQHSRIMYGNITSTFKPAVGRFYGTYFKGGLVLVGAGTIAWLLAMGIAFAVAAIAGPVKLDTSRNTQLAAMAVGAVVGLIAYLGTWPYFATRLQQIVWGNSHLGPVGFETRIRAWPLVWLVLKCVLLTVLTLGLYWPFAAVAIARYRIENMEVLAPAALNTTVAGVMARTDATGEGTADFFGLDVGL